MKTEKEIREMIEECKEEEKVFVEHRHYEDAFAQVIWINALKWVLGEDK